jgi:hypothetical protein
LILSTRDIALIFVALSAVCLSVGFAVAQETGENTRRAPPSIEQLAKEGFEVRGITTASGARGGYVVMMQRAQDVRTCLLRLSRERGRQPSKASVCM